MIFSKQIDEITWTDIEDFCAQKIPEGQTLDYKKDFPKNLEKSIAAFANTIGGIILIGIDEKDDNTPNIPIEGIENSRGLSERVVSIILSNITPPIMPEIGIITNSDDSRAVILIRIPQSNQTPHAIEHNTKVYLRTENRNFIEKLADIDKLQWLFNGREKNIKFREQIIESIDNRFNNYYKLKKEELSSKQKTIGKISNGWFTLIMCPTYPSEVLMSPPELNRLKNRIEVNEYYGTSNNFPLPDSRTRGKIVNSGSVLNFFADEMIFYTELGSFGIYYFKQSLLRTVNTYDEEIKTLRANEIIVRLDEFIDSSVKYFKEIGYFGNLYFELRLEKILGHKLLTFNNEKILISSDDFVNNKDSFLYNELKENKFEIILNMVKPVFWNFNWDISMQEIKECIRKLKGN